MTFTQIHERNLSANEYHLTSGPKRGNAKQVLKDFNFEFGSENLLLVVKRDPTTLHDGPWCPLIKAFVKPDLNKETMHYKKVCKNSDEEYE